MVHANSVELLCWHCLRVFLCATSIHLKTEVNGDRRKRSGFTGLKVLQRLCY